jgi:hypothetical protein
LWSATTLRISQPSNHGDDDRNTEQAPDIRLTEKHMMSGSRVLEAILDTKSIRRVFNLQNRQFDPTPLSILAEMDSAQLLRYHEETLATSCHTIRLQSS